MKKFLTRYATKKFKGFDQTGQSSKVRQSEKNNCDVNIIMDRFNRTGKLPNMQSSPARYLSCIGVDYQNSLQVVREAQEAFYDLPSATRKYFNHDPSEFLNFFENPENAPKALELGLAFKKEETPKDILKEISSSLKKEEK